MSKSFVILHHVQRDGEHWDLMVERDGVLLTWQLATDPVAAFAAADAAGQPPAPIPARRIADHRLAYLHYEGPISRGRGHVRRVERGMAELRPSGDDQWDLDLESATLRGHHAIRETADGLLFMRAADTGDQSG